LTVSKLPNGWLGRPIEKGLVTSANQYPHVAMVQSGQNWIDNDRASSLDWSLQRRQRILAQR